VSLRDSEPHRFENPRLPATELHKGHERFHVFAHVGHVSVKNPPREFDGISTKKFPRNVFYGILWSITLNCAGSPVWIFFARSRGFSVAVVLAIKSQPATVVQKKTPGQVCRTLLSLSPNR